MVIDNTKENNADESAEQYAIRRLTSKECFRLMGISDEDFEKAAEVVSETRRYHSAGDAIVVPVLMAIFSQLHIKGVKPWDDHTEDERYELIEEKIVRWL